MKAALKVVIGENIRARDPIWIGADGHPTQLGEARGVFFPVASGREPVPPVAGKHAGLTARQAEVLEIIVMYTKVKGFPPTLREIGNALSIRSTNGVNDHLVALEKKGAIHRSWGSGAKVTRALVVCAGVGKCKVCNAEAMKEKP